MDLNFRQRMLVDRYSPTGGLLNLRRWYEGSYETFNPGLCLYM
jgi:hypothetical protein